jgi:hypothetical protein
MKSPTEKPNVGSIAKLNVKKRVGPRYAKVVEKTVKTMRSKTSEKVTRLEVVALEAELQQSACI